MTFCEAGVVDDIANTLRICDRVGLFAELREKILIDLLIAFAGRVSLASTPSSSVFRNEALFSTGEGIEVLLTVQGLCDYEKYFVGEKNMEHWHWPLPPSSSPSCRVFDHEDGVREEYPLTRVHNHLKGIKMARSRVLDPTAQPWKNDRFYNLAFLHCLREQTGMRTRGL